MDIKVVDVSRKSVSGIAVPVRDPRVATNPDKDEDTRPFLTSALDGSPVEIDIYGPDHKLVKPLMDKQKARFTQQAMMVQSRKGVRIEASDIVSEEEENFEIAMAATHGWRGWTNGTEDGSERPAPFPYSKENAEALFLSNKDFVDQVVGALRDRSRFLEISKKR